MNIFKLACFFSFFTISAIFSEITDEELVKTLMTLPEWNKSSLSVERMSGGLSNINYKLIDEKCSYFVKKSLDNNQELETSLEQERLCQQMTAEKNISPKVFAYIPSENLLISDFINAKKSFCFASSIQKKRFCELLHKLHDADITFAKDFDALEAIDKYKNNAEKLGIILPESLLTLIQKAKENKYQFVSNRKKVPAHLDLHKGNILDDDESLWLIDWEHAAMADPFFDLATVVSVENLSIEDMDHLLFYYLKREPTIKEKQDFYYQKTLADIRWVLWEYIQAKTSSIEYDFLSDGKQFLKQALETFSYIDPTRQVMNISCNLPLHFEN